MGLLNSRRQFVSRTITQTRGTKYVQRTVVKSCVIDSKYSIEKLSDVMKRKIPKSKSWEISDMYEFPVYVFNPVCVLPRLSGSLLNLKKRIVTTTARVKFQLWNTDGKVPSVSTLSTKVVDELCSDPVWPVMFGFRQRVLCIPKCPKCDQPESLSFRRNRVEFECRRKVDNNRCFVRSSIVCNSLFRKSDFPFGANLQVMWRHCMGLDSSSISNDLDLHVNTIRAQLATCRSVMIEYNERRDIKLHGKLLQCDESVIVKKQKFHRGASVDFQSWIFGLCDFGSPLLRLFLVFDRSAETLVPIIHSYTDSESEIVSDCWAAYNKVNRKMKRVNHKINFLDPVHFGDSNKIEAVWRQAKFSFSKYRGLPKSCVEDYIGEFEFFRNFSDGSPTSKFFALLNAFKSFTEENQ